MRLGITAQRPSRLARYLAAALTVVAIAVLRHALFASFPALFLFTPAVVVLALFLGAGAGLLATLLAALSAGHVLLDIDPVGRLSTVQWAAVAVFTITNVGLVSLVVALRRAFREADASRAALAESAAAAVRREAFLASVLASSTDCIKVLDLDGKLTFMTEGGQRVMEVSDFNDIAGCSWPDFWSGGGHAEAVAAVEAARQGRASSFIDRANTLRGTPRWWHVAVSPILGPSGVPDRILSVSRDITALRESEEERDRFVRLAENSTDFIGMAHVDGRVFYMNDAARRLVGLEGADIAKLVIADFFPPEQVATVAAEVLPAVDRDGHWAGELTFRHFGTGELIPVLYSVFPVTDPDGRTFGYGTVTRDFRARKRAEENLQLLNREMAHRLKNTLAIVQSVATQTLRGVTERDLVAAFGERVLALSRAHDALVQRSWSKARLRAVLEGVLSMQAELGRFRFDGLDMEVNADAAMSLSLLMHELATNALKYGALSTEGGTVRIAWRAEEAAEPMLALEWAESGGPPARAPSGRTGFGSKLIRMGLLGTREADIRYEEGGLQAAFRAPLARVQA